MKTIQARIDKLTIARTDMHAYSDGTCVVKAVDPVGVTSILIDGPIADIHVEMYMYAVAAMQRGGPKQFTFSDLEYGDRFTYETDIARPRNVFVRVRDKTHGPNEHLHMCDNYRVFATHDRRALIIRVEPGQ